MRIYLDMCSVQRPLDDKDQLRVRIEAEAVLEIVAICEAGGAELVSSFALEYENGRNPHPTRMKHANQLLAKAIRFIGPSPEIETAARAYQEAGLKPVDAAHLACAVAAGADYFCTCDDRLRKRSLSLIAGAPKAVTPIELIGEIGI